MGESISYVKGDILYVPDDITGHKLNKNCFTKIKRIESEEIITTNQYGWRINEEDTRKKEKKKISFLGCSWPMGTGNSFNNSIVGCVEKNLQIESNNLGVGSFSLWQTILHLKKNLNLIKDTKIIILYGTWLLDRSLKDRSFKIMYRPILVKNTKTNLIEEKKSNNPPDLLIKFYTFLSRKNSNNTNVFYRSLIDLTLNFLSFLGMLFHGYHLSWLLKKIRLRNWRRLSLKKDREEVLNFCINELEKTLQKKKKKVHLIQLPEFFDIEGNRKNIIKEDREFLKKICANKKLINFYNSKNIEKRMKKFCSKEGLYKVFWRDNNHPNKRGSKILAKEICNIIRQIK